MSERPCFNSEALNGRACTCFFLIETKGCCQGVRLKRVVSEGPKRDGVSCGWLLDE